MEDFLNFTWVTNPEAWLALGTLTLLEVVLGIDNIIFISILSDKVPEHQRRKARQVGLILALVTRVLLLGCITWIMKLETPLFELFGKPITGKSLILIVGGLFLLGKSTMEIHEKLEGPKEDKQKNKASATFAHVIMQIMLLDVVFSVDSVITAVGMVDPSWITVMMIAVLISVVFMLLFVNTISDFVDRHPTFKMLALNFLLLIGLTLVIEGWGAHISKGYIYFAMGFSIFVEILNMRVRKAQTPVKLRNQLPE